MQLTFNQIGHDIPTFVDAAAMADSIMQSGVKYVLVVIVYNKFLNTIYYEAAMGEVKGADALKESSAYLIFVKRPPALSLFFLNPLKVYKNEDDATKDLSEFLLTAVLIKGHAGEWSAWYDLILTDFNYVFTQAILSILLQPYCHR